MNSHAPGPRISVVVPCYRSTTSLQQLAARLAVAMAPTGQSYELIFIDDASPEAATWSMLKSIRKLHPDVVRCYRLARNVGQHNAILCGFAKISPSAEIVVTMDDDLQHQPEDIPALIDAIDAGADMAIGAYQGKQHESWRNLGGKVVDDVLRRLFDLDRSFQLTSLRAIRRFAVDDVVDNNTRYSYLTAALLSVTRFRTNVPVVHAPRHEGLSGYSLASSIELAINLFLSYSRLPLYMIIGLFMVSLLATISITAWVFWHWIAVNHTPAGWVSMMLMLGVGNTFNLAALAIIALLSTRSHRQLVGSSRRWRVAESI